MHAINRWGIVILLFALSGLAGAVSITDSKNIGAPQSVLDVDAFSSVEVHDGARIFLRYGPAHRVTFLKGSADYTSVNVVNGKLIINKCKSNCPRGYRLELEIITPSISEITVADGGLIRSESGFPAQTNIALAVSNGGTIDARSIAVDSVTAAVREGGKILTQANRSLVGSVFNGGIVAYWGSPKVTSSISGGGVVTRGTEVEADE